MHYVLCHQLSSSWNSTPIVINKKYSFCTISHGIFNGSFLAIALWWLLLFMVPSTLSELLIFISSHLLLSNLGLLKVPASIGGLQYIGLQRVRHDWSNLACVHTQVFWSLQITWLLNFRDNWICTISKILLVAFVCFFRRGGKHWLHCHIHKKIFKFSMESLISPSFFSYPPFYYFDSSVCNFFTDIWLSWISSFPINLFLLKIGCLTVIFCTLIYIQTWKFLSPTSFLSLSKSLEIHNT